MRRMTHETHSAANPESAPAKISVLDSRPALRRTLLGLIVILAAYLRLHALAARSFWLDEGMSAEIARLRWSQFFLLLWHHEANMALYYLLLRFWMKMGNGEALVRGLSVIFAVATVPVIYALGRRLFGTAVGLAAAWLLAINAYDVWYSQEARSYALLVFLVTLSTWLLVRNIQQPADARWGVYALVSALAIYSQFFAALVILAQGVSLWWLRGSDFSWRDYLRSLRWIVYMTVPLAIFIIRVGVSPVNWIPRISASAVWNFFVQMAGFGGKWLVTLDVLALGVAAFAAWRANRARQRERSSAAWTYALVFSWLLLPILLTIGESLFTPFFVNRYLIICLPALMLGVAAGIARVRPVVLSALLLAAISILSLQGTRAYLHQEFDPYQEDWRSVTAYILDRAQPGDAIYFTPLARLPYEYYRSQRNPIPPGPTVLDAADGNELVYQDFTFTPLAESLRDARTAPDRVWIVSFWKIFPNGKSDRPTVMLSAVYGKGRALVDEKEFPNFTIRLFAADANGSGK
jgi:4-amino-4-deoxy-L-arabinose transferase-like glycosyltransferase